LISFSGQTGLTGSRKVDHNFIEARDDGVVLGINMDHIQCRFLLHFEKSIWGSVGMLFFSVVHFILQF